MQNTALKAQCTKNDPESNITPNSRNTFLCVDYASTSNLMFPEVILEDRAGVLGFWYLGLDTYCGRRLEILQNRARHLHLRIWA